MKPGKVIEIRGKTMGAAGEELGEAVTAPHAMAPAEFK